jgi:hypothetical protein
VIRGRGRVERREKVVALVMMVRRITSRGERGGG